MPCIRKYHRITLRWSFKVLPALTATLCTRLLSLILLARAAMHTTRLFATRQSLPFMAISAITEQQAAFIQAGIPRLRQAALTGQARSEEHTSELQSRQYLVC